MAKRPRIDPPSRAADGFRQLDVIDGRDPNREYVFTNPSDPETGTSYYLSIPGALTEVKRQDGPRLRGGDGVSEGEAITRMGQILVSYPRDYRADVDAEVAAKANAFDRRTLKTGNITDPLRGFHGTNTQVEADWPSAAQGD